MAVIRDKLTAPSTRRVRKAGRASSSRDGSISEVQIGQAEIDAATLLASLSDGVSSLLSNYRALD